MIYVLGRTYSNYDFENAGYELSLDYWELGWEIGLSRVRLLRDLLDGVVKDTDTIITLRDRMFLYESIFSNVIAWEDFDGSEYDEKYLKWEYNEPAISEIQNNPHRFKSDDMIKLLTLTNEEKNLDRPYFLVHFRHRDQDPARNLGIESYRMILSTLKNMNIDFVMFGKGSNVIAEEHDKEETSLADANSYMKGSNCLGVIGPISGGTMLALVSCSKPHYVLDIAGAINQGTQNHPIYHTQCSNFINAEIKLYRTFGSFMDQLYAISQ
jgi:hypothetical protein